jgi:hypothetical protein
MSAAATLKICFVETSMYSILSGISCSVGAADTGFDTFVHKLIFIIQTRIGLGDGEFFIHVGRHVFDFIGDKGHNLNILRNAAQFSQIRQA